MQERIKAVRASLGLTQQQFADRIGIKRQTVASYEIGNIAPSDTVIKAISREFGINENWIHNGVEPMFITRSTDEAITAYLSSLLNDSDTDLQRKIILLMSKLPPGTWSIIAQKAREVALEFPKDEKKE